MSACSRGWFDVAGRAGACRAVFGGVVGELGVAVTAERVEDGFRGPGQVRARLAMAVEATADACFVDEVVMAGDAVDGGVFLVRKADR